MGNRDVAKLKIADFEKRAGASKWPNLTRADVAQGLRDRIDDPDTIDQNRTSLCAASSFFHELVTDDPEKYAQTAIDLFEKGQATIGSLKLKPKSDLMNYKLNSNDIAPADWILAASLRDSGNWFLNYESTGDDASAITIPSTLAGWFRDAGYQDVKNETNLIVTKDFDNALETNKLKRLGYHVCMFVSANMLKTPQTPSVIPDHWIVMLSPIAKVNVDCCEFSCFTWGTKRKVPQTGRLRLKHFEWNYYGYVACKY